MRFGTRGVRDGGRRRHEGKNRWPNAASHPPAVEALESRRLLAATVPAGFQYSVYASVPNISTSQVFAPDGTLYFTEKAGNVRVVKNGATLAAPLLSLKVDTYAERGLECIELDPKFSTNGYFYVYYTVADPAKPNQPKNGAKNRVSRFKVDLSNPAKLDSSSPERILLDNIPTISGFHNGGALHFGADGMLYVTTGEAGSLPSVSVSQDLSSLGGKVLRINPATYPNVVPADNPYVNTPGVRGEVFAYGFRNPYSAAIKPGTNLLYVNDVGDAKWEEIDEVLPKKNYGWPKAEGPSTNPAFTNPIYAYPHSEANDGKSSSITGGVFYAGSTFPAQYRGKYFFSDFVNQYVHIYDPATGKVSKFADGLNGAFDLDVNPVDGNLYGLGPYGKFIWKISYKGGGTANRAPAAAASADVTSGKTPLTVRFDGSASTDPDGDALSYNWNFGDGTTGTGAKVSHTYAAAGTFSATLVVADGRGGSDASLPIAIRPGNQAPKPVITLPPAGTLYTAGQTITFAGTATDPEDGALPVSSYHWTINLHHDTHFHPFEEFTGVNGGSFVIPTVSETSPNQWYRVHLAVTDAQGLTAETFVDVNPELGQFTLASNVPGVNLTLDALPATAGQAVTGVVGAERQIAAPATQTVNGVTYQFTGWSDGGAATHVISTPSAATTYTATYKAVGGPSPSVTLSAAADSYVRNGPTAGGNFGGEASLVVKKSAGTSNTREAYLKFNVGSVSATALKNARLRLFGGINVATAQNFAVGLYSAAGTAWTETGLTWNNRPATAAALATVTLPDAKMRWYEWDLTSYLRAQRQAGKTVITLVLRGLSTSDAAALFNSKEAATNKPQLVVT